MEKKLTEQESLDLIAGMINQARNSFDERTGLSMKISGYGVAIISLLNFVLLYTLPQPAMSFHVWWLMFIVSIVSSIMSRKRRKETLVKNHMDKVISAAWNAFLCSIVLLGIMVVAYCVASHNYMFTVVITPVILIFMGTGLYVTAIASRSKEYKRGAFVFWISALITITLIALGYPNYQFIVLALASILGFVLPTHRVNKN